MELAAALLAGLLLLAGWLSGFVEAVPASVRPALDWAALVLGGFSTGRDVFRSLRRGKFAIDFLMFVAAIGAATIGAAGEAALLLFLFNLGHALEHYAMGRARSAIKALANLTPRTAVVKCGVEELEIRVEELEPGMIVLVKPNQRLAADGIVVAGESSVDQSPVTGESVPVDKRAVESGEDIPIEARVFAGTINGRGVLEVRVTKRSDQSTLARMVKMVTEAETRKSRTQLFTDRFQRWFVPAVLALVVLLLFAGLVVDEPFTASFYRAMAVLVAASPCALAIATPSAVLSAVARAGRAGVLVKGGEPLENLGRAATFAFDKTGTLTAGELRLVDVAPLSGESEEELLRYAVAIERRSDHPIARAVVRDGTARLGGGAGANDLEAVQVESVPGQGMTGIIGGQPVLAGNGDFFGAIDGAPLSAAALEVLGRFRERGCTTMAVRVGGRDRGVLGLMDTPRESGPGALAALRELGVRRIIMLSGDNPKAALSVGEQLGVDEARGGLLPEDKVEAVRALHDEAGVVMVGDGVNDAPAMAHATVGIAMGAAGSDVALETADVALMADDLGKLPFALGLGRATSRVIRQNLWVSLGMVAILVPATLSGLGIGPAVALHEGSTLVVVCNALRLLRFKMSPALRDRSTDRSN